MNFNTVIEPNGNCVILSSDSAQITVSTDVSFTVLEDANSFYNLNENTGGSLDDAPYDNAMYVRRNASWYVLNRISFPTEIDSYLHGQVGLLNQFRNIALGFSSDPDERFVTVNNLYSWGLLKEDGTLPGPVYMDTPPIPKGLTASSLIGAVSLQWEPAKNTYINHGKTEIFKANVDNITLATKLIEVPLLSQYTDEDGEIDTDYYYWIRFVSVAGVIGPFNAVNGTVCRMVSSAGKLLELLTGQLTATQLYADLRTPIELITAPGGLVEQQLAQATALQLESTTRQQQIANEASTRLALIQAEAQNTIALIQESSDALTAKSNEIKANLDKVREKATATFDTIKIWQFDENTEGWVSTGGALNVTAGRIRPAFSTNTKIIGPTISLSGIGFSDIRVRLRKVGNPIWTGKFEFKTTVNASFIPVTIIEPEYVNGESTAVWEMDTMPAWFLGSITQLQFTIALITDVDNYFDIDWIAVGRSAPGASTAAIFEERTARITADESIVSDILVLTASTENTAAAIEEESIARSNAILAEAVKREAIVAQITGGYEGTDLDMVTSGLLYSEKAARASAIEAEAYNRETLATQLTGGYTGTDIDSLSSGLLYNEKVARITFESSTVQQMALLSAGTNNQFDYSNIWYFDASIEGWGGNGTPTIVNAGWLRPVNHASNPSLISPVLSVNGTKYPQVRGRIKKVGTHVWKGFCYYITDVDATWNSAKRITIDEPTYDANVANVTWDMSGDWLNSTITAIRIELSTAQDASNYFEVDWLAIGRPSPGASSADLDTLQLAMTTADTALAQDLVLANTAIAGKASSGALDAVESRVTIAENNIISSSSSLIELNARLTQGPVLVNNFKNGLVDWVKDRHGDPLTVPVIPESMGTVVSNDSDFGYAGHFTFTGTGSNILTRNVIKIVPGRVYTLKVIFKVMSSDGSVGFNLVVSGMPTDYSSSLSPNFTSAQAITVTDGGVKELTFKFSTVGASGIQTIPAGTVFLRAGLRLNTAETGGTPVVFRIGTISFTDDTDILALQAASTANANATNLLDARVTQTEDTVLSQATDLLSLTADLGNTDIAVGIAQSSATSALNKLTDIASDTQFTPNEKVDIRREWELLATEKISLISRATSFAITTSLITAANTSFQALATYLNASVTWSTGIPSWISDTNLSVTTAITGSVFRSKFSDYYIARDALINALVDTKATASAVQALDARVGSTSGWIESIASAITRLSNVVGSAAAGALEALITRVTTAEGSIISQSSKLTQLDAQQQVSSILVNPLFSTWTSGYPTSWIGTGTAPTQVAIYNTVNYAVSGAASIRQDITFNYLFIDIELSFKLASGSLGGAGIIITWENTATTKFTQLSKLADLFTASAVMNKNIVTSIRLKRPSNFTGTFSKITIQLAANHIDLGTATTKNITFNSCKATASNDSAIATDSLTTRVNAVTTIEGVPQSIETMAQKTSDLLNFVGTSTSGAFKDLSSFVGTSASGLLKTVSTDVTNLKNTISGADATAFDQLKSDITSTVAGDISAVSTRTGFLEANVSNGGGNLIPGDTSFNLGVSGWTHSYSGGTTSGLIHNYGGANYIPTGLNQIGINSIGNVGTYFGMVFGNIPVIEGKRYCFSSYVGNSKCDVRLIISFKNAAGTQLGIANGTLTTSEGNLSGQGLASWLKLSIFGVAPTGTVKCDVVCRAYRKSGQSDPTVWICQPQLEEATALQTVPTLWKPSEGGVKAFIAAEELARTNGVAAVALSVNQLHSAIQGGSTPLPGNPYDATRIKFATLDLTASTAALDAAAAASDASNALTLASTANTTAQNFINDSVLTPNEKSVLRREWDTLVLDYAEVAASCAAYGITTPMTTLGNLRQLYANQLHGGTYPGSGIPSLIADANLNSNSNINPASFKPAYVNYYVQLSKVKQLLVDQVKATADGAIARWTVKATVGGLTGGVGFVNNGINVDFMINATRFSVFDPSTNNVVSPFMVIGGITYINTTLIGNATITNAKIDTLDVTKLVGNKTGFVKVNAGTLIVDDIGGDVTTIVQVLNNTVPMVFNSAGHTIVANISVPARVNGRPFICQFVVQGEATKSTTGSGTLAINFWKRADIAGLATAKRPTGLLVGAFEYVGPWQATGSSYTEPDEWHQLTPGTYWEIFQDHDNFWQGTVYFTETGIQSGGPGLERHVTTVYMQGWTKIGNPVLSSSFLIRLSGSRLVRVTSEMRVSANTSITNVPVGWGASSLETGGKSDTARNLIMTISSSITYTNNFLDVWVVTHR